MVFQNYALYPHMSVYENMSFGLRLKRYPKDEIARARAGGRAHPRHRAELLERKPRAALGRTAPARRHGPRDRAQPEGLPVRRAAVEPRRQAARADAHRDQALHQRVRTTIVYVTHDQIEAMTLADRVVVMNRGEDRADRRAERSLSRARDALRRRLHRFARDEPPALPAGAGRRRVARAPERRHRAAGAAVARGAIAVTSAATASPSGCVRST